MSKFAWIFLLGDNRPFFSALSNSSCQLFAAPFDVRLPEPDSEDIYTVVQPDVSIICDAKKIDDRGCLGSPDLINEVTFPSTLRRDIKEKFHLYEKSGTKEYWILYPDQNTTVVFKLDVNGKYGRPDIYCERDKIEVFLDISIAIDLAEVFVDD